MADKSALGEAVVQIRATMEKLEPDLNKAKSTIENIMGGIGKTIADIGKAGFTAFAAAASIAIGAVTKVTTELWKMAEGAVEVEGIRNAFDGLTKAAGTSGEEMLAAMKKGSNGTVSATKLMESYNLATQLVGSEFANELPNAMGYVQKVSAATGQDVGFLIDSLITGVGRLSPQILDNLGIQVNLTEANEKYAAQIGKTVSELTKEEQQIALTNAVMEKLEENTKDMPDVSENAATKMAQFQATMADLKTEMGVAFMPVLITVMDLFKNLAEKALPIIVPLVENFATSLVGLLDVFTPLLPIVEEFGGIIADALSLFMNGQADFGVLLLSLALEDLAKDLAEVLPEMIKFGGEAVISIVQGITSALPGLMKVAITIVNSLLDTIVPMLPEVLKTGIQILITLINGISDIIPKLIPLALDIIMELINTIISSLPMVLQTGIKILMELITGLAKTIPSLIPVVIDTVITFINTIMDNLPDIIAAGVEMLLALVIGIIEAIPNLVEAVPALFSALVKAIINLLPKLVDVGKDMVEGIKTGIGKAWDGLKKWFMGLIDGLVGSVKDFFGIKSPSKLFAEIGENLNRGLAVGIKASIVYPENELERMEMALIPEFGSILNGSLFRGSSDFNRTSPQNNVTNNYNLTAEYKNQDEITLIEQVRMLDLLGSAI